MALSTLQKEVIEAFHKSDWSYVNALPFFGVEGNDGVEALAHWYDLDALADEYTMEDEYPPDGDNWKPIS
jgi:hypothetical protein